MINWDETKLDFAVVNKSKGLTEYLKYKPALIDETLWADEGRKNGFATPWWELHERPVMQNWNGEGLPSVGTECLSKLTGSLWLKTKIVAINDNKIWMQLINDGWTPVNKIVSADEYTFKPLDTRTDEQKAIDDIKAYYCDHYDPLTAMEDIIFSAIKAGKIHNVKFTK